MPAHSIVERCRALAAMSESPTGLVRTFLSPPMREVHQRLRQWMEAAGMTVCMDAAGNLRGVYPAATAPAPRLLLGSHVDTVPDAGAFDGVLGCAGHRLVDALGGRRLPFSIEVAAFSEEEGVRSASRLSAAAAAGTLDADTARPARCRRR
jgi:allantoate deiminase